MIYQRYSMCKIFISVGSFKINNRFTSHIFIPHIFQGINSLVKCEFKSLKNMNHYWRTNEGEICLEINLCTDKFM